QNFNLTIGQQVKEITFEFGYLGNLGRHVPFPNINLNHIPTELLSRTEIPTRLRRPYPQFPGDTAQVQILSPNWGISNYHAFVLKSEKRMASGLSWLFTYTLSKWIDNVVFVGGDDATFGDDDQVQNIYDLRNERSLSTNDIRHRMVTGAIYELPFGKGKRWLKNGFLNQAFGGWSLSTIATLQSGSPFGITGLNGPRGIFGDNADGKNLRPNIVGDRRPAGNPEGQAGDGRSARDSMVQSGCLCGASAFYLWQRLAHGDDRAGASQFRHGGAEELRVQRTIPLTVPLRDVQCVQHATIRFARQYAGREWVRRRGRGRIESGVAVRAEALLLKTDATVVLL